MKLQFVVVLFFYNIVGLVSYNYEAEECDYGKGTCKTVVDCPVANRALLQRKPHGLQRCGFEGLLEVVCCPNGLKPKGPDISKINGNSKSERACIEYTNEVPADPTPLILGGENATLGEFPHMAALGYASEDSGTVWECGGTLISNRYVLTAAHCIVKKDGITPSVVRLGVVDITGRDNVQPQDYVVVNYTIHHDYNRRQKLNDLALIRLSKDVTTSTNVHPACLYQKGDEPQGLVVTGWGFTSVGGSPSTILQKAKLQPVHVDECSEVYRSRLQRAVTGAQICAKSDDGKKDTCQGDSGGPLQAQNRDASSIYSIVGVTSYGMGCGGLTPGIYTRVSSYLEWIERIVWP